MQEYVWFNVVLGTKPRASYELGKAIILPMGLLLQPCIIITVADILGGPSDILTGVSQ